MKLVKERVLQIMDQLETLSEHDYRTFSLALVLFLRSDKEAVELLSEADLDKLDDIVWESDSILDLDREEIDYILEGEEE